MESREWKAYAHHDSIESVMTQMEAFRDEFSRLASTPEQQQLAGQFRNFVDLLSPTHVAQLARPAVDRTLAQQEPDRGR